MKTVTPTELRANIYQLLDEILVTGIPIEINKGGQLLRISPVEASSKLDKLIPRSDVINGDPDDLMDIHWDGDVNIDLP